MPYDKLGGIFSSIKYLDPDQYQHEATAAQCQRLIFGKMLPAQRLIISDETLTEQSAIHYTPAMMPVRIIAERLHALFGPATILFTIRSQFHYAVSMYQVLKRNYSELSNTAIEPFNAWFAGNHTQLSNLFLRNLDFSHAIKIYQSVFGGDAVRVLPLELLTRDGNVAYLKQLGEILGLPISPAEAEEYRPRNQSPPHSIVLSRRQRHTISERAAAGNAWLAETFNLPLREFGYPLPPKSAQIDRAQRVMRRTVNALRNRMIPKPKP